MEYLRVKNLRSLVDTEQVQIKPITLLVGSNSSGKSTFVRVFPLIKQSHEMRSVGGLVLNEGDVDFGFFNDALHRGAEPREMSFEFGFTSSFGLQLNPGWYQSNLQPLDISCELTYVQRSRDSQHPRLRSVRLELNFSEDKDVIILSSEEDGYLSEFRVNEYVSSENERASFRLQIAKSIVPQLTLIVDEKRNSSLTFESAERGITPFDSRLLEETYGSFHGRTLELTRLAILRDVQLGSPSKMLQDMKKTGTPFWQDKIRHWEKDSPGFKAVRNLLVAQRMVGILDFMNAYISNLAKSVNYIGPTRATAQRDYLNKDTPTLNVEPDGSNVAMVLAGMSDADQNRFRQWTKRHLAIEFFQRSVGGGARISLWMKDELGKGEYNLADTGFGFSQVLPIVLQMWILSEQKSENLKGWQNPFTRFPRHFPPVDSIVVVEQPELHLHPALQAKLADCIVAVTKLSREQRRPVRFVLETHSTTIIERVGESIELGLLDATDAQVLLFELKTGAEGSNTTGVCKTEFDPKGVIKDWPFGFLSAPLAAPSYGGERVG